MYLQKLQGYKISQFNMQGSGPRALNMKWKVTYYFIKKIHESLWLIWDKMLILQCLHHHLYFHMPITVTHDKIQTHWKSQDTYLPFPQLQHWAQPMVPGTQDCVDLLMLLQHWAQQMVPGTQDCVDLLMLDLDQTIWMLNQWQSHLGELKIKNKNQWYHEHCIQ